MPAGCVGCSCVLLRLFGWIFCPKWLAMATADAVAKRYRPWPKGLRADSLPWFDSPLVQGASRLRYTDKAQMQRPGHTGRKALATKKKWLAMATMWAMTPGSSGTRPSSLC